ncbi:MAG: hypothetical protein PHQ81_02965 [Methanofollis sp.]|nr:hypothetical protein [Methanofollis sp.]
MSARTESEIDDRIIEVLEVVVKYVIWFIAFLLILSTLEIESPLFWQARGLLGSSSPSRRRTSFPTSSVVRSS